MTSSTPSIISVVALAVALGGVALSSTAVASPSTRSGPATPARATGASTIPTTGSAATVAATTIGATTPTSGVATTATATTTTTTTAPPVDLLQGVEWIQRVYASPCGPGNVQMVGGSAVDADSLAVLDDIVPLQPTAGLAIAFLSCHGLGGATTEVTALLVQAASWGFVASIAEAKLGAAARVVDVEAPAFTVETAIGAAGTCCAPLIRRQQYAASAEGFTVTADRQVPAFRQTVTAHPAVGGDADLIRSSVPAAALCYRWDNVYLASDPEAGPAPISQPSAELQTVRMALIHLTGQWIAPTSQMNAEMALVTTAYQESRGLAADGVVGSETMNALAVDLGCPGGQSFGQVDPPALGPRKFRNVSDLVLAADRFAATARSGNESLDALLIASRWDGDRALFLGCSRWESPSAGVSCAWSGATPLQLIGLLAQPASGGVENFSILYARSAAAD